MPKDRTGRRGGGRGRPPASLVGAIAVLVMLAAPTHAAEGWTTAAGGATALAPVPREGRGIDAVQLACAGQRWTMLLRTNRDFPAGYVSGPVVLRIDGTGFELEGAVGRRGVEARLPRDVLEPLKAGGGMIVGVGDGESRGSASLSLRGSRQAIEAIAPLCSPRDMAGYRRLALDEGGAAVEVAAVVMRDEIALYRRAAGISPTIAAAVLDLEGDRRLLAVSLCGKSAYFGDTGCNVTMHVSTAATAGWREVYNTEGVSLYLRPGEAVDGWPSFTAIASGEDEAYGWRWDGDAYVPAGSEDQP